MPVSKSDRATGKICKFCDEAACCRIWKIKLDHDILHAIKKKFPNWFAPLKNKSKKYSLTYTRGDNMSEGQSSSSESAYNVMEPKETRVSPPKAIVDSSPLTMDKNRESLKVKLLVRRSANQLVEQGILPPLKTSPAIHEQKKLLERAKTGDLLKAKIQQRPNRQELERRHILESHESHIDPSLADKYRMLEKAILVDQLNKKILHRPGPLELIEKNILHANEPIERIVKEGLVPFKVAGEDSLEKNFLSFEDDSQSSEGDLFHHSSQLQPEVTLSEYTSEPGPSSQDTNIFESLPTSSGVINISLVPTNSLLASTSTPISLATFKLHNPNVEAINIPPPPPPPKLELITYHVKPIVQSQVKGLINTQNFLPIQITETPITNLNTVIAPSLVPSQTQSAVNQHVSSFIQNNQKFSGKEKNRKKCKNKATSKARAIKFHEYKGPPNKGGSSSSSSSSSASLAANKKGETNYEFIMQQQCLLEYLEGIYKNPHAISEKPECESQKFVNKPIKIEKSQEFMNEEKPTIIQEKSKTFNKPHVTIFPSKPSAQSPPSSSAEMSKDTSITDVSKLSKMKVSELKAYLKRVNLPVSGPKPLLIERLKPYLPLKPLEENDDTSTMMSEGNDFYNSSLHSVSSAESDNLDNMDCSKSLKDEQQIVAEQQRKIEELQRKLQQSQQELEQMKQHKPADGPTQTIVFEPQYQMQNQISAVYVVDVAEPTEEPHSPAKIKTPMLYEPATSSINDVPTVELMLSQEKESNLSNNKNANASTSNVIPMSQDITDVLEILLKNGEWPELSEDGKCFIQTLSENSQLSNENTLNTKHFISNVLSINNPFDVMSPMNEDPILHADEVIDKILDTAPANGSSSIVQGNFSGGYNSASNIEFPMDIEDDTSVPITSAEFNRNLFQNSDFLEKPHTNILQSYEQNHFDGMKMQNCDNQFMKSVKKEGGESPIAKSEFSQKSPISCTKNGLIGNFDHNLFDTLKNNNINNNNNNFNDMFLIPQDGKFAKDDSKSLINNLHFPNSFDYTGIDNSVMDFENIIPYNDLPTHDSLLQFDNRVGNYGHFNDHSSSSLLFNDDTRMSNGGESMTCEVDNLLCNL